MAEAKVSEEFKPRWEEPPASERGPGRKASPRIEKEVDAMRKRPGKWMKVREAASSGAYTVYKKRGCEVRVKSVGLIDGQQRYDVWARWPEDGKPAQ